MTVYLHDTLRTGQPDVEDPQLRETSGSRVSSARTEEVAEWVD